MRLGPLSEKQRYASTVEGALIDIQAYAAEGSAETLFDILLSIELSVL